MIKLTFPTWSKAAIGVICTGAGAYLRLMDHSLAIGFGIGLLLCGGAFLTWLSLELYGKYLTEKKIEPLFNRLSKISKSQIDFSKKTESNLLFLADSIEKNIRESDEKLRSAQGIRDRFISSISEDIRTPLAQIISDIHELANSKQVQDASLIKSLQSSSFKLLSSLNNFLEVVDSHQGSPTETRVINFFQIGQDLIESYAEHFYEKNGIILHVLVDPYLPKFFSGDPKHILQLVSNFIEEARLRPDCTEISLSIRGSKSGNSVEKSKCIKIACSDNSVVLESPTITRINRELAEDGDASELSLRLQGCKKISNAYNGTIEIAMGEFHGNKTTATLFLKPITEPTSIPHVASSFGFATSEKDIFCSIGKMGMFLGIRPIPVPNPAIANNFDVVYIGGTELLNGTYGPLESFQAKTRCVVILRYDEFKHRDYLISHGFCRFLLFPISSGTFVQSLMNQDEVHTATPLRKEIVRQPIKVLVVDDMAITRMRIAEVIQQMGHIAEEASDGLEFVRRISRGEHFDLVICDLTMTHLDGGPALQQVREIEKATQNRIFAVAMSAYTLGSNTIEISEFGFDGLLTKPVYPDSLAKLISQVMIQKESSIDNSLSIIDLEDLRKRALGKNALMIKVLQSFIETSQLRLKDLEKFSHGSDLVLITQTVHALKGILLEAGAIESAHKLAEMEKQVSRSGKIEPSKVKQVSEIVETARLAASSLIKGL